MRLVNVPPGPLDAKAVDGLTEFARTWPGELVVVTPHEEAQSDVYRVVTEPEDIASAIRLLRPDVITALHRPEFEWLNELAPSVYTSEVTRRIRTDLQHVTANGRIDKMRITLGQFRRDRLFKRMAKASAGLQCNGYAAWRSYGRLTPHSMMFREHRIREGDLELAKERFTWDGSRPLRVAFSGRVTAVKGPETVLTVAAQLPQMEFSIFGDGDLRERLEASAPANVAFHGHMTFVQWKEYVRNNVDIALLPHPQGDPSGTYYEMMGSGVPVVGVRNTTWRELADREHLGWAEKDAFSIAARIATLTPHDLDLARERAFKIVEPFEVTSARRMAHLADIARSARS